MIKKFLIPVLFFLAVIGPSVALAATFETQTTVDDWSTLNDSSERKAQGFVAGSTHTVTDIKVKVFIDGTPGTMTVGLYSNNGGVPGSLITSGTFNANSVTTSHVGDVVNVHMGSEVTINSGTRYIIVMSGGSDLDAPESDIAWRGLVDSGFTPTSIQSTNGGSSWSSLQPDAFYFQVLGNIISSPPPPQTDTFGISYIRTNENHFASTTGFTLSAAVIWAGQNLYEVFIGSGLALLYALRYWIVALVIIGAIVYFAYRAFRFFKH